MARHDLDEPSFPRMLAAFLSIFHPKAGPSVLFQVPDDFVGSTSANDAWPLVASESAAKSATTASESTTYRASSLSQTQDAAFNINFDYISEYVIPKRQLCGRSISVCHGGYRVLGFPIAMEGSHYERNAFIFNCCVVFHENDDVSSYIPIVKQLAMTLRSMEELKGILSQEEDRHIVYHVIEQVMEDLNNYCECMIPVVDDEVTLNLKLFPKYVDPPQVRLWDVPVPTVKLRELCARNWDLSLQRVILHIDGTASVAKIAERADVDPRVAVSCCRHLLYVGCLAITDIFQYDACYAPTPELSRLSSDAQQREEVRQYVALPGFPPRDFARILELYASMRHDTTLRDWAKSMIKRRRRRLTTPVADRATVSSRTSRPPTARNLEVAGESRSTASSQTRAGRSDSQHAKGGRARSRSKAGMLDEEENLLIGIDIRRLVSYGVIKGVIYRIHRYPVLLSTPSHAALSRVGQARGRLLRGESGESDRSRRANDDDVSPGRALPAKPRGSIRPPLGPSQPSQQSIRKAAPAPTGDEELQDLESDTVRAERRQRLLQLLSAINPQSALLHGTNAPARADERPSTPLHLDAICSAMHCSARLILQDLQDLAIDISSTNSSSALHLQQGREHALSHGQLYVISK